jgi:hypothetical protein
MVAFTRLQSAQRQHLTIHARAWSNGGFRLIVAYPNGLRKIHCFATDLALFNGTMALQAELTANGWDAVHPIKPSIQMRPLINTLFTRH